MLEDISIKDFALIDSASIDFSEGFTVLSGETGAGKSLLIGALTFLLGGKGGVEQIRAGCREATVSATFHLGEGKSRRAAESGAEPTNAFEWLDLHGIVCEDDRIVLRRYIRENGKSGAWIGSTAVTRADLASFCSFLVDIHGQHEHQNLMKVSEHRTFLDSYAGLSETVQGFTALYSLLVKKRARLSELGAGDREREQRRELLGFAVREISEAKLRSGEDAELDDEECRLSSFEKLCSDIEAVSAALDGDGGGVVSALKKACGAAEHAVSLDKGLDALSQRLDSAFYELSDIVGEYKSYAGSLVFDPERLSAVQERQTLIYNLKKKYASSVSAPVDEVIAYLSAAEEQLSRLDAGESDKESLEKEIAGLEKEIFSRAKEISARRKEAAARLSASVVSVLSKLGMASTRFSVRVSDKDGSEQTQKIGPHGCDDIEFLISANPGQPLQPLAKIASGGELSRVMLSLKTVLASSDPVGTMIFDEIDTGIGGEVAVSIGSHLKSLAEKRQVLCITHLASIAVYADNQLKIQKSVKDGVTETRVFPIAGEERVREIARMLSGDAAGAVSLDHARAMLAKFS